MCYNGIYTCPMTPLISGSLLDLLATFSCTGPGNRLCRKNVEENSPRTDNGNEGAEDYKINLTEKCCAMDITVGYFTHCLGAHCPLFNISRVSYLKSGSYQLKAAFNISSSERSSHKTQQFWAELAQFSANFSDCISDETADDYSYQYSSSKSNVPLLLLQLIFITCLSPLTHRQDFRTDQSFQQSRLIKLKIWWLG